VEPSGSLSDTAQSVVESTDMAAQIALRPARAKPTQPKRLRGNISGIRDLSNQAAQSSEERQACEAMARLAVLNLQQKSAAFAPEVFSSLRVLVLMGELCKRVGCSNERGSGPTPDRQGGGLGQEIIVYFPEGFFFFFFPKINFKKRAPEIFRRSRLAAKLGHLDCPRCYRQKQIRRGRVNILPLRAWSTLHSNNSSDLRGFGCFDPARWPSLPALFVRSPVCALTSSPKLARGFPTQVQIDDAIRV